jgi:hypothetical protein
MVRLGRDRGGGPPRWRGTVFWVGLFVWVCVCCAAAPSTGSSTVFPELNNAFVAGLSSSPEEFLPRIVGSEWTWTMLAMAGKQHAPSLRVLQAQIDGA